MVIDISLPILKPLSPVLNSGNFILIEKVFKDHIENTFTRSGKFSIYIFQKVRKEYFLCAAVIRG